MMTRSAKKIINDFNSAVRDGSGDCLFVRKLRVGLTDEQIALVIVVLDSTCDECFDAESGCCSCWNDE